MYQKNGFWWAMISKSSEVNEKTSALWLYGAQSATSGAMYRSEPVIPVSERRLSSSFSPGGSRAQSRQRPKSKSTTRPEWVKPRLLGLRSLWSTR